MEKVTRAAVRRNIHLRLPDWPEVAGLTNVALSSFVRVLVHRAVTLGTCAPNRSALLAEDVVAARSKADRLVETSLFCAHARDTNQSWIKCAVARGTLHEDVRGPTKWTVNRLTLVPPAAHAARREHHVSLSSVANRSS